MEERVLTLEEKELIKQMFFGPFLNEWRNAKGIIDNTDETISKRTGIPFEKVRNYLTIIVDKHFQRVTQEINSDPKYLVNKMVGKNFLKIPLEEPDIQYHPLDNYLYKTFESKLNFE